MGPPASESEFMTEIMRILVLSGIVLMLVQNQVEIIRGMTISSMAGRSGFSTGGNMVAL